MPIRSDDYPRPSTVDATETADANPGEPRELVEPLRALSVQPGQRLIIEVDPMTSAEAGHRLVEDLKQKWPDVDVVVIAGGRVVEDRG